MGGGSCIHRGGSRQLADQVTRWSSKKWPVEKGVRKFLRPKKILEPFPRYRKVSFILGDVNRGENMSSEDKPKSRLFNTLTGIARTAAKVLLKQGTQEVIGQAQEFYDTRLKPALLDVKDEIEEKLFSRIKAELKKQFLYQWVAIIVGIGIAIVVAWAK